MARFRVHVLRLLSVMSVAQKETFHAGWLASLVQSKCSSNICGIKIPNAYLYVQFK